MRTFDGFKVVFTEGLLEMKSLKQDSPKYQAMEQQLGLPTTELRLLKGALGIRGSTWQRYKAAFIAGRSASE